MVIDRQWESPVVSVPDDLVAVEDSKVDVAFTRNTALTPSVWANPQCYIEVFAMLSMDGGNTWDVLGGWGAYGGRHVRKDGTEGSHSQWPLPLPKGVGRLVKFVVTPSLPFEAEAYLSLLNKGQDGSTNVRQLGIYK